MINVLVATHMWAVPSSGSAEAEYEQYVETLTQLHSFATHPCVRLMVTASVLESLASAERLPPWEPGAIVFLQREDVARLFYGAITRMPYIEDALGIAEVLLDRITVLPTEHVDSVPRALLADYERTLGLVCVAQLLGPSIDALTLLTTGLVETGTIEIQATIVDVDGPAAAVLPARPFDHRCEAPAAPSASHCLVAADPLALARQGYIHEGITLAVAAHLLRTGHESTTIWETAAARVRLHSSFHQTVQATGILRERGSASAFFRACVETVMGGQLRDTHVIRTGKSGNSPQRCRHSDGAGAWRRDIDRDYHLHYWSTPHGPELAAVVTHNDFNIPE